MGHVLEPATAWTTSERLRLLLHSPKLRFAGLLRSSRQGALYSDAGGYAPIYRRFGHSWREVPEILEAGYKSGRPALPNVLLQPSRTVNKSLRQLPLCLVQRLTRDTHRPLQICRLPESNHCSAVA